MISFRASISDNPSAIKRSGKLEGGGMISLDVPETDVAKLATLMALVLMPLEVTVKPLADISTGEITAEPRKKGRRATEGVVDEAVEWARSTPAEEPPARVPDPDAKNLLQQLGKGKGALSPEQTFGGGGKAPLPRPDADKVI